MGRGGIGSPYAHGARALIPDSSPLVTPPVGVVFGSLEHVNNSYPRAALNRATVWGSFGSNTGSGAGKAREGFHLLTR